MLDSQTNPCVALPIYSLDWTEWIQSQSRFVQESQLQYTGHTTEHLLVALSKHHVPAQRARAALGTCFERSAKDQANRKYTAIKWRKGQFSHQLDFLTTQIKPNQVGTKLKVLEWVWILLLPSSRLRNPVFQQKKICQDWVTTSSWFSDSKSLQGSQGIGSCPSFESGSRPQLPTKSWASWDATPEGLRSSNSSRDLEFVARSPGASRETVWMNDWRKIMKNSSMKGCNLYHWTNHDPISLKTLTAGDKLLDLLGSYTAKNPSSVGVKSSPLITVLDFCRWWPVSKGNPPNAASCMHQNQ